MSQRTQSSRRRLLQVTGSVATIGLAGCIGSEGDTGSEETPDPSTETTEEGSGHHDDGDDHHDETPDEEDGHGHGHDHDQGMPEEPSPSAEVSMRTEDDEYHYAPHLVWVEPGGTVTWTLENGQHNVVAYHPDNDKPRRMPEDAESFESELLEVVDATFSHTFDVEGVYDYYCTPHESAGMVGTVIVGTPDAHEQAALEEPQMSLPEGARAELADLADQVNQALGHTH